MYIGSTTQPLCKRMAGHRKNYKRWLKGKYQYVSSFDIIKYEDAYIELLEARPCKNKDELRILEGSYIRNRQCVNKLIAGRSMKQYRIDNKEKIAQYYIDNKEKISKQTAQYYIDNKEKIRARCAVKKECPCGGRYTHGNKSQHMKSKMHQKYISSI
jgi:hypothetical protein